MKEILNFFTSKHEDYETNLYWFCTEVNEGSMIHLKETDLILYLFLKYCMELSIPADRIYLVNYLKTELKSVVRANNIKIAGVTDLFDFTVPSLFDQTISLTRSEVISRYDDYIEESTELVFKVVARDYLGRQIKEGLKKDLLSIYQSLVSDESVIGTFSEHRDNVLGLEELFSINKLKVLDKFGKHTLVGHELDLEYVCPIGLPAFDDPLFGAGGIYTRLMYTLAGQPGHGKSRFACALAYICAVEGKCGVRYDSFELNVKEVEDILTSIHIAKIFGKKIPDRMMQQKDLFDKLTEGQKRMVSMAKQDLFESGKYGDIHISRHPYTVETLETYNRTFASKNPDTRLVIIDYLGKLQSKPLYGRPMAEPEIISKGSFGIKESCVENNQAAFVLSQFNEKGIANASMGLPIDFGHIQGGQVIQRDSDWDASMTSTEEQAAANISVFSTTKVRKGEQVRGVIVDKDLSISRWTQRKSSRVVS